MVFGAVVIMTASTLFAAEPVTTPVGFGEVIRADSPLRGKEVCIVGNVRFDRRSRRGFLYADENELRVRDYRRTVFLQLPDGDVKSFRIRDGTRVVVTGFFTESMHGPLGVYPVHVLVKNIVRLNAILDRQAKD